MAVCAFQNSCRSGPLLTESAWASPNESDARSGPSMTVTTLAPDLGVTIPMELVTLSGWELAPSSFSVAQ